MEPDLVSRIEMAMSGIGFPVLSKPPGSRPALPEDITLLDDEGLMALFTALTIWTDYAAAEAAICAMQEKQEAAEIDAAKARQFLKHRAEGVAVTDARAQAEAEVATKLDESFEMSAYRKMLDVVCSNLERDAALVSRELSRRLGEKSGGVHRKRAFGA